MSRIFTVSFPFRGDEYTALVNLSHREYNLSCEVRYLNKEAEVLIPEKKITFSLAGGIESPHKLQGLVAEELVQQTSMAIYDHLRQHD